MKYSVHGKLLCELSMLLTSSDTKRTLMHLFLFTNSAHREVKYVRRVHATAINFPCIITLICAMFIGHKQTNKKERKRKIDLTDNFMYYFFLNLCLNEKS